nr:hypothetical protein TetV2_00292 [Oceanusvirus sp.]
MVNAKTTSAIVFGGSAAVLSGILLTLVILAVSPPDRSQTKTRPTLNEIPPIETPKKTGPSAAELDIRRRQKIEQLQREQQAADTAVDTAAATYTPPRNDYILVDADDFIELEDDDILLETDDDRPFQPTSKTSPTTGKGKTNDDDDEEEDDDEEDDEEDEETKKKKQGGGSSSGDNITSFGFLLAVLCASASIPR